MSSSNASTSASNGIKLNNQMKSDFNDHDFNTFNDVKMPSNKPENRRVLLRNVSTEMKPETILRLLKHFGNILDDRINIPRNQDNFNNKKGFMCVFAEFETFPGAEKAHRELNSEKNQGLGIRVDFAYQKQSNTNTLEMSIAQLVQEEETAAASAKKEEEEEEIMVHHPPITVDYDTEIDDIHEKVTVFDRKKVAITYEANEQLKVWMKLASQSKGTYDVDTESLIFNRELIESGIKNQCSNCEKEAILQCEKSFFYFCSIKCSMVKEEPLNVFKESLGTNELIYDEPIKENELVVISSIINEKCVFVRRANIDDSRLMNAVLKHSKGALKMEVFPDVGDLVLAHWIDEVFRAIVIDVSEEEPYTISVQLIDYGNTARLLLNDLSVMGPECQRLECTAHKLFLKDVEIDALNTFIVDYFNEFLSEKTELAVTSIDAEEVVLVDKSTGTNINRRIVELSIVEDTTYDTDYVILDEYDGDTEIPSGISQKVFVVNNQPDAVSSEIISCVSESNMRDFRELYKGINAYAKKQKSDDYGIPGRENQMCLAYSNNLWHRAIVLKAEGDGKPKVMLVDLWNIQKIKCENIIPMPKAFKYPPPLSALCKYTAEVPAKEKEWLNVKNVVLDRELGFSILTMN